MAHPRSASSEMMASIACIIALFTTSYSLANANRRGWSSQRRFTSVLIPVYSEPPLHRMIFTNQACTCPARTERCKSIAQRRVSASTSIALTGWVGEDEEPA